MEKIISCSENTNIFSYKGILKRKNYFIFTLVVILINTLLNLITKKIIDADMYSFFQGMAFVISILIVVASVFATIKRLRDIGWWKWLAIISIMPILMLVLSCIPSKSFDENGRKPILERLKDFSVNTLGAILIIGYWGIGLLQWAAIYAGVYAYTENWIISLILGGFVAYIPILGTVAGIYGAHAFWNFPLWAAILLFTFHYIFWFLFTIFQMILEWIESRRRNV
ncbi:MAG: DUF805 domain-containing protein [Cyanobacteria bacterium SIG31]|nr:DUF805 domain-containing protein [Cyanobacteria bacterium SIG31]